MQVSRCRQYLDKRRYSVKTTQHAIRYYSPQALQTLSYLGQPEKGIASIEFNAYRFHPSLDVSVVLLAPCFLVPASTNPRFPFRKFSKLRLKTVR